MNNVGRNFICKYGMHFVRQDRHVVEPISAAKLKEGIHASRDNSPSLDGVLAADLQVLSANALEWLAAMFRAVPPLR